MIISPFPRSLESSYNLPKVTWLKSVGAESQIQVCLPQPDPTEPRSQPAMVREDWDPRRRFSTGNSTQYSVITSMGKESERVGI